MMTTVDRAASDRVSLGERGIALVIALLAMLVMAALGAALMLSAATESKITRNFKNNVEAFYAADAALEKAVGELRAIPDWNLVLAGSVRSAFADGTPHGQRVLGDGRTIDLAEILNDINCGKRGGCTTAALDAVTADRPWGSNNPRWQLFAWGHLRDVASTGMINSRFYVLVLVADDPSECDDNPFVDGGPIASCPSGTNVNPGAGVLMLRTEAFGPFGAHRAIEVTIARQDGTAKTPEVMPTGGTAENTGNTAGYAVSGGQGDVRILSWREAR